MIYTPSINELKNAFFSLKLNKIAGYDNISFDAIRNCFDKIYDLLQYAFNILLEIDLFLNTFTITQK